jgi:hypothetical protein
MELGIDLEQHFHTSMEPLTSSRFEVGTYYHPFRGPASGLGFGDGGSGLLVFLDKFHITVTSRLMAFRQFGFYPILIGYLAFYHLLHEAVEFV